jgi:hypothetical protein
MMISVSEAEVRWRDGLEVKVEVEVKVARLFEKASMSFDGDLARV